MNRRALHVTLVSALAALTGAVACGCGDDAEPLDETPIVGLMELPISRNNQGTAPQGAGRIEVSPTELRLDYQKLLDLERGRPAADQVSDHVITRLLEGLRGGAARSKVSLKVHATVPYLTLVNILNTVQEAGIHEAHFAVRTLGNEPTEAWMPITDFQVVPHGEDITWGTRTLPWSAFTEHWRTVYEACRAPGRPLFIDCDAPYANTAEGGELEMELWTRGMGMKVTFSQVNPPEPEAGGGGGGVAMMEGIAPVAPAAADGEEPQGPPATTGAFSMRHQQAIGEESGISNLVAPVCANQACQSVVVADATGMTMRIVSLLGAVYSNGYTPGEVAFRIPED